MLYSHECAGFTDRAVREALWTEGDVVRKLRTLAGWKLKQLAELSGVSLTMIHELEVGKTKEAKRATLTRIAGAFGLTLHDLLDLVPKQAVRLDVPMPQPKAPSRREAERGRSRKSEDAALRKRGRSTS